jgi:hypothetical protein
MAGGGCPGSITINGQNHEKLRKHTKTAKTTQTIKHHQNLMDIKYQNYQKQPKPDGNQKKW